MPKQKLEQSSTVGQVTVPDKDIHDRCLELVKTISSSWYKLSKELVTIYDAALWTQKGYTNFQQYVEGLLRLDYRTTINRVVQGRAIIKHNLSEDQVVSMKETNFKEISTLLVNDLPEEEVTQLIELGATSTFREIQEVVAQLKAQKVGGERVENVHITLVMPRDAWEVIETGLREAGEYVGSDAKTSTKLEYIVHEWTYHHNPELAETIKAVLTSNKNTGSVNKNKHTRIDKGKPRSKYKKVTVNE